MARSTPTPPLAPALGKLCGRALYLREQVLCEAGCAMNWCAQHSCSRLRPDLLPAVRASHGAYCFYCSFPNTPPHASVGAKEPAWLTPGTANSSNLQHVCPSSRIGNAYVAAQGDVTAHLGHVHLLT